MSRSNTQNPFAQYAFALLFAFLLLTSLICPQAYAAESSASTSEKEFEAYSVASQKALNSDAVLDENGVLHITETHLLEFSEPKAYKHLTEEAENNRNLIALPKAKTNPDIPPLTYRWSLPTNSDGKALGVFKLKGIQYRMPSGNDSSEIIKLVETEPDNSEWAADKYYPSESINQQSESDYYFASVYIYFDNLYEKLPAKVRKDSMTVELSVEYELDGLVRVYPEDAEMDWAIFGTHWKNNIGNATATLTLPGEKTKSDILVLPWKNCKSVSHEVLEDGQTMISTPSSKTVPVLGARVLFSASRLAPTLPVIENVRFPRLTALMQAHSSEFITALVSSLLVFLILFVNGPSLWGAFRKVRNLKQKNQELPDWTHLQTCEEMLDIHPAVIAYLYWGDNKEFWFNKALVASILRLGDQGLLHVRTEGKTIILSRDKNAQPRILDYVDKATYDFVAAIVPAGEDVNLTEAIREFATKEPNLYLGWCDTWVEAVKQLARNEDLNIVEGVKTSQHIWVLLISSALSLLALFMATKTQIWGLTAFALTPLAATAVNWTALISICNGKGLKANKHGEGIKNAVTEFSKWVPTGEPSSDFSKLESGRERTMTILALVMGASISAQLLGENSNIVETSTQFTDQMASIFATANIAKDALRSSSHSGGVFGCGGGCGGGGCGGGCGGCGGF